VRRRQFIAGLGGAAAWPLAARAQQPDRVRRIGVLMGFNDSDPEGSLWLSRFTRELSGLGWADGRNAQIEVRWGGGDVERTRTFAKELVGLQPDVILSHGTPVTAALQHETQTIPIVFVTVADPVGEGYVASLSHPRGNLTGFIFTEGAMAGKWLELLKEIAPQVTKAAIIYNPDASPGRGTYYLPAFEAAAVSLKVQAIPLSVHTDAEIEAAITTFAREPGSTGIVAGAEPFTLVHRRPIIALAARYNLPAVYFQAVFVRDGGLLSYGPDNADIFRRAAPYVDRILRGARPSELPVQVPTKFEMSINLKTAKALGLTVPLTLQASADEVIE
jgi:putative tryptophan/tyrosine transport system substrate-binding protein